MILLDSNRMMSFYFGELHATLAGAFPYCTLLALS